MVCLGDCRARLNYLASEIKAPLAAISQTRQEFLNFSLGTIINIQIWLWELGLQRKSMQAGLGDDFPRIRWVAD